jgi:TonB-linked SusC/RagA family outer membrane protein
MYKKNKTISLKVNLQKAFLLFCFVALCGLLPAQNANKASSKVAVAKKITGVITDNNGESIIGASVIVKGVNSGTITDMNGKFSLTIPEKATLIISYIGYTSKTISVGPETNLKISLSEDTKNLEEVVVVGYGQQKKITVTGAVSQVKGSELMKSPVANLTQALVGRTAGVMSIGGSGQPGADDVQLRIRGIGTTGTATPLTLVDGIERSFSQLDPNEIETISVLKDASSTAVYGIRGANGVIIVTTKKGVEGKPVISYNGNYAVQSATALPKFLRAYDFATVYNEGLRNDNPLTNSTFTPAELQKFKDHSDPLFYPDTDWESLLLNKYAPQNQHNINISGGTKDVKYFVSLGTVHQEGLIKNFLFGSGGASNNNAYDRYNFRSNIDVNFTPTTTVNFQLGGYSATRNSSLGQEGLGSSGVSFLSTLFDSAPTATIGMYDGKIITLDRSGNRNVIQQLADGFVTYNNNSLNINLGVNQKLDFILKGLSARAKIAYDNQYSQSRSFGHSMVSYTPVRLAAIAPDTIGQIVLRPNGDIGSMINDPVTSYTRSRQFYIDAALEYNNSFGKNNVSALLLYNQKKRYYHGLSYPEIPIGYQDFVGRVTYNYDLRYLLEFNLGRNGSENFPKQSRFGWFPALSAGWIVTSEPTVQKLIGTDALSYLKLRASYGQVGNDQMNATRFMYLAQEYTAGGYGVFGETPTTYGSFIEGKLGNPNISWEKANKFDIAADMKFFKDQLSINVDYFSEYRTNIITTRKTVPSYVAISLQDGYNLGIVENKGIEVEGGWNSKIRDFRYWINGNFSFARNKIIEMDETLNTQNPQLNRTGHSVGQNFGYVFDGFFNTADEVASAPNYFGKKPTLGDTKYVDVNKDGIIDQNDQQAIGGPTFPEISFGLSLGFSYKGFDFSTLFQGSGNYSVVVTDRLYKPFAAFGAALENTLNRWSPNNTPEQNALATFPKLTVTYASAQNYYTSTLNTYDASYLRLKNMELGYTFSKPRPSMKTDNVVFHSIIDYNIGGKPLYEII